LPTIPDSIPLDKRVLILLDMSRYNLRRRAHTISDIPVYPSEPSLSQGEGDSDSGELSSNISSLTKSSRSSSKDASHRVPDSPVPANDSGTAIDESPANARSSNDVPPANVRSSNDESAPVHDEQSSPSFERVVTPSIERLSYEVPQFYETPHVAAKAKSEAPGTAYFTDFGWNGEDTDPHDDDDADWQEVSRSRDRHDDRQRKRAGMRTSTSSPASPSPYSGPMYFPANVHVNAGDDQDVASVLDETDDESVVSSDSRSRRKRLRRAERKKAERDAEPEMPAVHIPGLENNNSFMRMLIDRMTPTQRAAYANRMQVVHPTGPDYVDSLSQTGISGFYSDPDNVFVEGNLQSTEPRATIPLFSATVTAAPGPSTTAARADLTDADGGREPRRYTAAEKAKGRAPPETTPSAEHEVPKLSNDDAEAVRQRIAQIEAQIAVDKMLATAMQEALDAETARSLENDKHPECKIVLTVLLACVPTIQRSRAHPHRELDPRYSLS